MISPEDIETLRNYFQPVTESGNSLPDASSAVDNTLFILRNTDKTKDLYILDNGTWKLIKSGLGG